MLGQCFDQLPDVLVPEEVMGYLRLGRNSVYQMLRDGRLASIRVGRKRLIPKAALRKMLEVEAKPA